MTSFSQCIRVLHLVAAFLCVTSLHGQHGPIPAIPSPQASQPTHGMDATVTATREYLKTGQSRTVRSGDFLAFPYGKRQPTLSCAPLRTCLIRLQAGEQVLGSPALGDSERWLTGMMAMGPNGNTPLVYVKPIECDITTNLIIATDRHLYHVMLDAPPCAPGPINNAKEPYTLHLMFYYPDETAQQWAAQSAARANDIVFATSPPGTAPDDLHFAYDMKKDRRFPWKPKQVFDDGTHLYIKRPPKAAQAHAPVLFGVNTDGSRVLLNVTLRRDYYITDRVMDRVVLVIPDGKKEQRMTLTRRGRD